MRSTLVDALTGAFAAAGTEPVRVEGTEGGEGTATPDGRLSTSLHALWVETFGPAPAIPADLAERLDPLADRFDEIRGRWDDADARDRHWLPADAAFIRAARPLLHHHTGMGEPPAPGVAPAEEPVSSGSASERSTAGRGTRGAAGPSPTDGAAAAVRQPAPHPLHTYAAAVASELQLSIDRWTTWRDRQRRSRTPRTPRSPRR